MNFLKKINKKIVTTTKLSDKLKKIYFGVFLFFLKVQVRFKASRSKKIKVSFLMVSIDVWKLDSVVERMTEDDNFEVSVIICPFISQGKNVEEKNLENSIKHFENKKIFYLIGQNISCEADDFLAQSGIIFYSNPNAHTEKKYMYYSWMHKLTCFTIYSFRVSSYYKYEFGHPIMLTAWRNYVETDYHSKLSLEYGSPKVSLVTSGYPKFEEYLNNIYKRNDYLTILYAPHWTIKGAQSSGHDWATFLDYQDCIINFVKQNDEKVKLIFKPHPLLKNTLEKVWGDKKTNEYFEDLSQSKNIKVAVNEGYTEHFNDSDLLIHDSGGFLVEYLLQNKPCAFLMNQNFHTEKYNSYGLKAIDIHERINSEEKLKTFLEKALLRNLELNNHHQAFTENLFQNELPSQIILRDIKKKLWIN